jgi:hypothetical protein
MGGRDVAPRVDVLGETAPRFVDVLFTGSAETSNRYPITVTEKLEEGFTVAPTARTALHPEPA